MSRHSLLRTAMFILATLAGVRHGEAQNAKVMYTYRTSFEVPEHSMAIPDATSEECTLWSVSVSEGSADRWCYKACLVAGTATVVSTTGEHDTGSEEEQSAALRQAVGKEVTVLVDRCGRIDRRGSRDRQEILGYSASSVVDNMFRLLSPNLPEDLEFEAGKEWETPVTKDPWTLSGGGPLRCESVTVRTNGQVRIRLYGEWDRDDATGSRSFLLEGCPPAVKAASSESSRKLGPTRIAEFVRRGEGALQVLEGSVGLPSSP